MKRTVVFAEEAAQDLDDIHTSLLQRFGRQRADRAVDDLYAHCSSFDLFPHRGQAHRKLEPALRTLGYRRLATIVFVVEPEQVTILRIFTAGRDIRVDDI